MDPDAQTAGAPRSVCVVLHDFEIGGVPLLYTDLLARLGRSGVGCTTVAAGGPLLERAQAAGVPAVEADWKAPPHQSYDLVARVTERFEACVVVCDPELVHVLPAALASCGRVLVAVHSEARGLAAWFGEPGLARLRLLTRAVAASPSAALTARGEPHRRALAGLLGLDARAVRVLAPGIATDEIAFQPAAARRGGGEAEVVLLVSRLSAEVAARLHAAVELVAAGLAAGRDCRLEIVGDGPWREQALDRCRRRLPPERWSHESWTLDPIARIRSASVVVASNLTALQAAAAGSRVVLARVSDDGRPLGPVLDRNSFHGFSGDIFGTDLAAEEPGRAWARLDGLDGKELAELRALVESHNSGDSQAAGLLAALAGLDPMPSSERRLVGAFGEVAARLETELAQSRAAADRLWLAREWYEGQLEQLRAGAGER